MTPTPAPAAPSAPETHVDPGTALIVVDLHESVRRLPYAHPVGDVAARADELAAAFRQRGLPVVFTLVAGLDLGRSDRRMEAGGSLTPADLELMPELAAGPDDLRVAKRHWGAFTGTDLHAELTRRGGSRRSSSPASRPDSGWSPRPGTRASSAIT